MTELTSEDIERIATLARLQLTAAEKERYAKDLSVVFAYMEQLNEVETDNVKETCQVTGLEDVVREDAPVPCSDSRKKELIDAFPDRVGNLLRVPAVFDENLETRK
jgi:aspartyl-tRNA(Asn)/glutamyl-tRNA(Gln) amidotransferase subunit C